MIEDVQPPTQEASITGTTTQEGEAVEVLRACVRKLEPLDIPTRKRVAEYLWVWTREPVFKVDQMR